MQRRRFATAMSLFVAAAMFLSACTGSKAKDPAPPANNTPPPANTPAPPPAPPKEPVPAKGGELVLHVPEDPDTFAFYWAQSSYTYDVTEKVFGGGLLDLDPFTQQMVPHLAEAMPKISDDNKTFTFELKKGIKFHDGTEVKAKDIVFAYEILMSDDYQGRSKSRVANLESVKATGDYTVEFKTKDVFAPFMYTVPIEAPLPTHILGSVPVKDMPEHAFWKNPIGAGAWKFVEWKPGQHSIVARFDDFWAKGQEGSQLAADATKKGTQGPWYDTIRLRVIPEATTAVAALEEGALSMYGSMQASQVDRLKADYKDKLVAMDWDRMGYGYQTFNLEKYPTDIKEVRQALSHGLNRDAIIKGVLDNKASLPAGFVPPIHWVYNANLKPYDYNPAKAEELLKQAGFTKNAKGIYEKDGKPLKITYYGTQGNDTISGIALQAQKDWGAIGFEVELQLVDFNTLLAGLRTGDFNVSFSGLGFSADPYSSFENFNSRNIRKDESGNNLGSNTSRFTNPKVDELVTQAALTFDQNKRKQMYQEAEALIMESAPVNPIYVNLYTDFAKKEVKGVSSANGYGTDLNSFYNQVYEKTQ